MAAIDLTCKELVELVTDYLEERMTPSERLRFEQHLVDCEGCRSYLDQMRETIRLLGRLDEDSIPVPTQARLLRAFRDWKS
jgi:predicted anti-sigma-YlaC factor YlaD